MDPLLIVTLLRSLALLTGDSALGYRGTSVVSVLKLIAAAVEVGSAGKDELTHLAQVVDQMVAEGREPTKAEWAELKHRSDVAHDILNPPPPPAVEEHE